MTKKTIGKDLLHTHPQLEKRLGLDGAHVIVDREDYNAVVAFFEAYQHYTDWVVNKIQN